MTDAPKPRKLTRRDRIVLAALGVTIACVIGLGTFVSAGRWVVVVPFLIFDVFSIVVMWPLRARQWVATFVVCVLMGVFWAGLVPSFVLWLISMALWLVFAFLTAVYDGYRGA